MGTQTQGVALGWCVAHRWCCRIGDSLPPSFLFLQKHSSLAHGNEGWADVLPCGGWMKWARSARALPWAGVWRADGAVELAIHAGGRRRAEMGRMGEMGRTGPMMLITIGHRGPLCPMGGEAGFSNDHASLLSVVGCGLRGGRGSCARAGRPPGGSPVRAA